MKSRRLFTGFIVILMVLMAAVSFATVSSTISQVQYTASGGTVFPYTFKIFAATDLIVVLTDSGGISTTETLNTDYTVSGVGTATGGNVTFGTAPTSGFTVTISRVLPYTQQLHYIPNAPFPSTSSESALDKLTMLIQQLSTRVNSLVSSASSLLYPLYGSDLIVSGGPWVDIRAYGATGDIAVDTAALQAAVATGKNVFIPLGIFYITDETVITTNGQSIIGAGPGSVLYNATTNKNTLVINAGVDRALISNLSIIGNASATGSETTAAIHSPTGGAAITNLTINKVWIKNYNGCGIAIGEVNNGILSDSYVESCYSHNVYLSVCTNFMVSNLYSKNGAARDIAKGNDLKIKNSSVINVVNPICSGGSLSNISIEGDGYASVHDINLTNSTCDVSVAGSYCLAIGSTEAAVSKITVTGGTYTTVAGCYAPIWIKGTTGGLIPSNVQLNGVTAISPDNNAVIGTYGDNIRFNAGYYAGVAGNYAIDLASTCAGWFFNGVQTGVGYGIRHQGTKFIASGCYHNGVAGQSYVPGSSTAAYISGCFDTNGIVFAKSLSTAKTTGPVTLTTQDSGSSYTNAGAGGAVEFDLPPATAGLAYGPFTRIATQAMSIHPSGSEIIRGGSAGQYAQLDTDGANLSLKCYVAGTWEIVYSRGTVTYH